MAESSESRWRRLARTRATASEASATDSAPRSRLVDGVPRSLIIAAGWSWRGLVVAAATALIIYLIITFKTIISAVLVAMLVTVLLEPLAGWMGRVLRFPRALSAGLAIVLLLGFVGGLLTLAGRSIVEGFGQLADRVRLAIDELLDWLANGPIGADQQQIDDWLGQVNDQVSANSDTLINGVLGATSSVASVLTGAVLMFFCLFFFLKDGRRIWHWIVRLFPGEARDRVNEAGIRGWVTLGSYTRTQILVALVDAVGIGIGALILGVPLALPIAILVFLFSFIPIIGAVLSGFVAVAVALVDQGIVTALIMLGVVLLVQQLEGNVLQPWLQGNALALHPLAIVLSVTAGTGIAGLLGALFAVPVVATLNTVMQYFYGRDKYPKLADDPNRSGGPPGAYLSDGRRGSARKSGQADSASTDTASVTDETTTGSGSAATSASGTGAHGIDDRDEK